MFLSWLWLTYLVTVHGDTTIVRTGSPPEAKWSEVAMDDSGKVQYGLSAEYSLFSSVDYGTTWTITNEELKGGVSVACDSSGQLLLVGTFKTLFISDDYGRTVDRVQSVPEGEYYSVAYSGDGKYLVGALVGGGIYMSNDFGESWTMRLTSPPSGSFWRSVTISANGQHVYAVPSLGDLYRSMDAGITWSNNTVSSKDWKDVDVDDTGTIVTASSVYGLVQSIDGGVTWIDLPTLSIDIEVEDISESANGQCIVVSGSGKPLWISTDQGQTWTAMDVPSAKWSAVVISRNCDFILASVEDGGLFLSQNQGTDWVVHIATCEAGTGYSNGDCRSCNVITSPTGMYNNDGSDLYCGECPSFTVSFDSITCTNPCHYPFVPDRDYFTTPASDQCLDINFQVSVYVVAFIVLSISALYLLHLVLLFVHIPQLGKYHRLALLTVVCTAIPCLEVMVGLLYVFTMTIYNEFLAIAMFLALLLHPTLLVVRDFWYQRTERHMHVRIWGERLLSTEVWEWLQYHRLVTDQWLAFVVANVVFGMITVLNLIWIVPMLVWLLLLYATKLYAFAAYARTWHGWWSGYYETSIPLVMTLTHGRNTAYVVDVHRFHEFSLWSVCLQSIPMLILVIYNAERMKQTDQTTSSAPSASVVAGLVIFSAICSILLVVYRMIVYRWIMNWSLKDMPTLLHGLNEAAMDDEDADYGTSPIRKSAGGRDSLRYSALQVDGVTGGGGGGGGGTVVNELFKATGTKVPKEQQYQHTTVYQRRQFRQRQMALRRDHVRAKMKDADVAWERRMRQARMTIQRRFNQIQTIVQMQLYQSSSSGTSDVHTMGGSGAYEGGKAGSISGPSSSSSLMATADLLQPRPSFSSLQQPPTTATGTAAAAVDSSILPSVDLDETENVDLLVRDIERTLKTLDAELAQFLSEEIESKLTALAVELRRKGSLIPGTPSDRGSFS